MNTVIKEKTINIGKKLKTSRITHTKILIKNLANLK